MCKSKGHCGRVECRKEGRGLGAVPGLQGRARPSGVRRGNGPTSPTNGLGSVCRARTSRKAEPAGVRGFPFAISADLPRAKHTRTARISDNSRYGCFDWPVCSQGGQPGGGRCNYRDDERQTRAGLPLLGCFTSYCESNSDDDERRTVHSSRLASSPCLSESQQKSIDPADTATRCSCSGKGNERFERREMRRHGSMKIRRL
ncbi:hypothetical protein IWZ01DRAFT_346340 [Phyllosticta capitalensis]